MKRRSVHDELYELRAATLELFQSRGVVLNKEEARRWERLRQALRLPAESTQQPNPATRR